ncbi:MAG TPA: type III pantothenate kinase [Bacteroidales bacterium]|nr:type III pantothenate kinase [Bacteroidales bacterium]
MLLALDIGNTSINSGIFSADKLIRVYTFNLAVSKSYFDKIFNDFPQIKIVAVCDVIQQWQKMENLFLQRNISVFKIDTNTKLFFKSNYITHNTLGKDRLSAIAGGIALFPNTALLIVDAGTAITFDYVNDKGVFLGGRISPGINLRFSVLHTQTKKLPLLNKTINFPKIGTTTNEAILSGVLDGVVKEIEGVITDFKQQNLISKVIFTGGDAKFLHNIIKFNIFVLPNLVLKGIYELYKFNNQ